MKDIECPYCGFAQDVNHDDGQGYAEDELHEMECESCKKRFVFRTAILFYYTPQKADCLNGKPHDFKPTSTYPKEFTMMECTQCGERRDPTREELSVILNQ